jgi:tripartite-type tricarboxylate transporter receptor subunit TctC
MLAVLVPLGASAQIPVWPIRPVRIIVPSTAGSASDILTRIVSEELGQRLGYRFLVENQPGASGRIAVQNLARSTPDGYTLGLITTSTNAVSAAVSPTLPYDPVKSFSTISLIGNSPYVLAVRSSLPANSVSELVALAKDKPGEIRNGTFGTESLAYLAGAWFSSLAGVTFNQITYRSTALAVLDLVGARIDTQFATLPPTVPPIREGKVRALAVTGSKRVEALPLVPTFAEQGMQALRISLWMGFAVSIANMLSNRPIVCRRFGKGRGVAEFPGPFPFYAAGFTSGRLARRSSKLAVSTSVVPSNRTARTLPLAISWYILSCEHFAMSQAVISVPRRFFE